ncbi:MAG: hypothetical protein K0S10_1810 [Rubrobacteraceae bacterium]|nr:hypothetical protein [Rubrobacteraceae bacterium]
MRWTNCWGSAGLHLAELWFAGRARHPTATSRGSRVHLGTEGPGSTHDPEIPSPWSCNSAPCWTQELLRCSLRLLHSEASSPIHEAAKRSVRGGSLFPFAAYKRPVFVEHLGSGSRPAGWRIGPASRRKRDCGFFPAVRIAATPRCSLPISSAFRNEHDPLRCISLRFSEYLESGLLGGSRLGESPLEQPRVVQDQAA